MTEDIKKKDLYKFQCSKYVQSDIGDTYRKAKELLDNDKYVLFTGTPCQIEGLYKFLRKDYDKLYTQDFICHGVPSPIVWRKYLKETNNKYSAQPKIFHLEVKIIVGKILSLKYNTKITYIEIHREKIHI